MEVRIGNFGRVKNNKEDNRMIEIIKLIQNTNLNDNNEMGGKLSKEIKVGVENVCSHIPAFFFISVLERLKNEQKKFGKFNVSEVCRNVQRECYPALGDDGATKVSTGITTYLRTLEIITAVNKSRIYSISDMDRIDKLIRNPFIAETKEWTA